jgi:hypothetical protein
MKSNHLNDKAASGVERTCPHPDDSALQLWTASFESLLRAYLQEAVCLDDGEERNAIIDRLICRIRDSMLCELAKYQATNVNDAKPVCPVNEAEKHIITVMRQWHLLKAGAPMQGWQFNRKTRKYPPDVIAAALLRLQAQGRLKVEKIINNRKAAIIYVLTEE